MVLQALKYTVYYDGNCGLCHASIRWIHRRDTKEVFQYIPLQEAGGQSPEIARAGSVVLRDQAGQLHFRSGAVGQICRALGWPWKGVFYVFKWVPVPVADRMYDLVARNRHRWKGRDVSCTVPLQSPKLDSM
jgi:predicted DCC family thiol-disulfide oxidoreductase YuxK